MLFIARLSLSCETDEQIIKTVKKKRKTIDRMPEMASSQTLFLLNV